MDISFSGSEITLLTGLLGSVVGALTFLYRQLIGEKDRQIRRLESQMDQGLLPVIASLRADVGALQANVGGLTSEVQGLRATLARRSS